MADNSSDPSRILAISEAGHSPQPDQGFGLLVEAMRVAAEAQFDYGQALLRANAALFNAWFDQPVRPLAQERPSVAARESYFSQPEFIQPEVV